MVNSISSVSSSSYSDALTSATKKALEKVNIDTKTITTETEGKSTLASVKRKAEAQAAKTHKKAADTNDEAFKYEKMETPQSEASETETSNSESSEK